MIVTRPAIMEDAEWIGKNLRAEDEQEVWAATGKDPYTAVRNSFMVSNECYASFPVLHGTISKYPAVIFGVCTDPLNTRLGIVWLLATDMIAKCGLSVMHESARWLEHLSRNYPGGLHNCADERNSLHVQWCLRNNFKVKGKVNGLKPLTTFLHIHRPNNV